MIDWLRLGLVSAVASIHLCAAPLALAQDASKAQATANPQAVGALQDWCKIDDPSSWSAERQRIISSGAKKLPEFLACPHTSPATDIPEVLHLPMPCGRKMVFNRIDVPVDHALDQTMGNFGRSVDISAEKPQIVLSNGAWSAPVSGAFSIARDGANGVSDSLSDISARASRFEGLSIGALALLRRNIVGSTLRRRGSNLCPFEVTALGSNQTFDAAGANGRFGPLPNVSD